MDNLPLILASQSPDRLRLLKSVFLTPDKILPADIDESEFKGELPKDVAMRLAKAKGEKVASDIANGYIISADSVASIGRRTLPKALNEEDIKYCLNMLSGKKTKLQTGVSVIKKLDNQIIGQSHKLVTTIVKIKRLSEEDMRFLIASGDGINKAGGYSIQGPGQCFIEYIQGSFSNVVGLPLCELRNMLVGLGYQHKVSETFTYPTLKVSN